MVTARHAPTGSRVLPASAERLRVAMMAVTGAHGIASDALSSVRNPGAIDWEDRWRTFLRSYVDHLCDADDLRVDLLAGLARRPEYREALLPPTSYRYAWRLLYGVPADALGRISGTAATRSGVARGRRYDALDMQDAVSWTVDPSIFTGSHMPFVDVEREVPIVGSYVVVIRAPIEQPRRRFWLNPDVMYGLAKSRRMSVEREVVSTGRVSGCDVAWGEGKAPPDYDPDSAPDYDAERLLIPEIAERCIALIEGP